MSGMMDMLTGASARRQEKAAALARRQQGVDQTRQLAELQDRTAAESPTRRAPRGRRLFADAAVADLPGTVA